VPAPTRAPAGAAALTPGQVGVQVFVDDMTGAVTVSVDRVRPDGSDGNGGGGGSGGEGPPEGRAAAAAWQGAGAPAGLELARVVSAPNTVHFAKVRARPHAHVCVCVCARVRVRVGG
jgi:hypothetical protein